MTRLSQDSSEPIAFAERVCSDIEFPEDGLPVYSLDHAYAILDEVTQTESRPAEGDEPPAWATVVFRRNDGHKLQIGQSDAGWLLILHRTPETPTRISIGEQPALPRVVFFLPEWTDFERRHVLPEHRAREALALWLKGGDPGAVIDFRP